MGREDASYELDYVYVRKLRKSKGLSQQELAGLAEKNGDQLAYSTIRKLERKNDSDEQRIKVSADTLKAAAKHLLGDQERWQELLSSEERLRLGLQPINDATFTSTNLTLSAVDDFTGRTKELAEIKQHLQSGNAVCITAIKAAGGMGKTQLARKSAEDLASQFPDGTYLLELDGMTKPKTPTAVMKELIAKCIPGTGLLPDKIPELQPVYLAALGSKKLLLVFDNADDAGQVSPLLKDLPKSVGVIITSRKLISLPYVKRIDLEVMSSMDAVTLLNGIVTQTRSDLSEDDLKAIAVLCGHLPLALRVAGTMLRDDKKWTQKRFAKALQDDPLHHLTLGADEYNVGAILRLSVQQLVLLNAEQAERFQMLSVFPGTFAEDAAATVWNLDEDETFTDLDELQNRSLIEWDEKTTRYRLHDLMRPVARDAFPSEHPLASGGDARIGQAQQRHAEHYVKVLREANDGLLTVGLAHYDLEVENITAGRLWSDAHIQSDPNAAMQFVFYSLNGANLYRFRLSTGELVELYERSVEVSLQLKFSEGEARAKSYLGDTLATLGHIEWSLTLYLEAAELFQELGDARGKAVTMGSIADILQQLGNTDEALRIRLEVCIPFCESFCDSRGKAVTMGKIADILQQRGQYDEALLIYREECIPVFNRLGDVRSKAVTMSKIADIFEQRGETEEALCNLEAIKIIFHDLGDVQQKAVTMGKIADILEQRGLFDEALRIRHMECIPVYERFGDVREKAVTMGRIADILQFRGQTVNALRIRREEELPVYERLGDVREKAVTMGKIADILHQLGKTEEALRILNEEVIPVYERLGEVREKAITMGKIADILQLRGQTDEALRIYREEQLTVYERLGDVHSTMVCRANIGIILKTKPARTKAESEEARDHLRWALATAEKHQYAEAAQLREYVTQVFGGSV